MYSYELAAMVHDGMVKRQDYVEHFNATASPQITNLKYNPFDNKFELHTNDDCHLVFGVTA